MLQLLSLTGCILRGSKHVLIPLHLKVLRTLDLELQQLPLLLLANSIILFECHEQVFTSIYMIG